VNITVDPDGNNISGVEHILCFNNTLLNAISLESGAFFSGFDIDTHGEGINNNAGTVDYCELMKAPITEGVTTPGTFTTITFQAIGEHGLSDLYFKKVTLSDPGGYRIQNVAYNGRVGIDQPSTPFMVSGYVFNDDGGECNNPAVTITNLNTSRDWAAVAAESSNYYRTMLESCADVIVGEVLRFDTAGCSQSNTTSHTVTQAEVNAGGFENNITLGTAGSDTTPPTITNIANDTPTDSSVTITWTTDEDSDSLVKYGTTSGTYTDDESDAAMVTLHSITLTGLSSDMTYYFVVNSTDASDNSNESEEHNFTMAAVGPPELISCVITPTPPVVQGTNVSIDCLFSERVDYEIRIENATGALIEMIGSGTEKDPDPKWWNTTTGTPAGIYTVNVTMDNSTSGLSPYNNTNTIEVTAASDTTAPTITDNSSTGTDVPVTTNVTVTFDEAMNKTSAEGAFSITPDVAGTFSWSGDTMIFTPDADLTYETTCNITIGTDAKDLAGSPLAESFEWNFATTTVPDYSPSLVNYTISNTTISPNGDGIMDDTAIDVEFSETVNAAILIENATGIIRTLYTDTGVTDPDPQRWNGTDNDGNIVADGTYHVNITMDDGVNPLVYNNTETIVVANMSVISIGNARGNVTVPITIEDATWKGSTHRVHFFKCPIGSTHRVRW